VIEKERGGEIIKEYCTVSLSIFVPVAKGFFSIFSMPAMLSL